MSRARSAPVATFCLQGADGTGKTTIARALGELLRLRGPTLLLDASADRGLTRLFCPGAPVEAALTPLERLFARTDAFTTFLTSSGSAPREQREQREQIDWRFRDALFDCGDGLDLLSLGGLPQTLTPGAARALEYGLSRLLSEYAYSVVDGTLASLNATLLSAPLPPIPTLTMGPDAAPPVLAADADWATPAVIIVGESPQSPLSPTLSAWLAEACERGDVRLMARLPQWTTPLAGGEALHRALETGLFRLGALSR